MISTLLMAASATAPVRDRIVLIRNMGHITSIILDLQSGKLMVTGFTVPPVVGSVALGGSAIFTQPALAIIPHGLNEVTAAAIDSLELAVPLASVFTCDLGNCERPAPPGPLQCATNETGGGRRRDRGPVGLRRVRTAMRFLQSNPGRDHAGGCPGRRSRE